MNKTGIGKLITLAAIGLSIAIPKYLAHKTYNITENYTNLIENFYLLQENKNIIESELELLTNINHRLVPKIIDDKKDSLQYYNNKLQSIKQSREYKKYIEELPYWTGEALAPRIK